jgi:ABC-type dipeptide/oligopeptide/nickel transport system permease subunit
MLGAWWIVAEPTLLMLVVALVVQMVGDGLRRR